VIISALKNLEDKQFEMGKKQIRMEQDVCEIKKHTSSKACCTIM
jgi:hypothetical protein